MRGINKSEQKWAVRLSSKWTQGPQRAWSLEGRATRTKKPYSDRTSTLSSPLSEINKRKRNLSQTMAPALFLLEKEAASEKVGRRKSRFCKRLPLLIFQLVAQPLNGRPGLMVSDGRGEPPPDPQTASIKARVSIAHKAHLLT